ncbi:MAG: DUF3341 domain-containing protein [Bacteroidota bacterium]
MNAGSTLHGVMAEFGSPEELLAATKQVAAAGYTKVEAYSPLPVEGVSETLGFHTRLPLIVLIAGVLGAIFGFGLQYWINVIDYPINIGGRPYNSWPSFIPVTFECTVLFAGVTAVIAMIALNRLPQPYHPVFNVPRFGLATDDRFFLTIEAADPQFEAGKVRRLLQDLRPSGIFDVEE